MSRKVPAGRVGRPHGLDGSFHVDRASHPLPLGTPVEAAGATRPVVRRAGTDERPILGLDGIDDREAASALRGEPLLLDEADAPLEEGEYLVDDLLGCTVPGVGEVRRVIGGPSCDVLEVGPEAVLVPLVSDAVTSVDLERRVIEVDRTFLGLDAAGEGREQL